MRRRRKHRDRVPNGDHLDAHDFCTGGGSSLDHRIIADHGHAHREIPRRLAGRVSGVDKEKPPSVAEVVDASDASSCPKWTIDPVDAPPTFAEYGGATISIVAKLLLC